MRSRVYTLRVGPASEDPSELCLEGNYLLQPIIIGVSNFPFHGQVAVPSMLLSASAFSRSRFFLSKKMRKGPDCSYDLRILKVGKERQIGLQEK